MYCRVYQTNTFVINYKSSVKELYFIQKGIVGVFNNDADYLHPKDIIDKYGNNKKISMEASLYLPKKSYFGDY